MNKPFKCILAALVIVWAVASAAETASAQSLIQADHVNFLWRLDVGGGDHMATSSEGEFNSFPTDGQYYYAPSNPFAGSLELRRLYNSTIGDHAISTDPNELDGSGYTAEGAIGHLFPDQRPGTVEVTRWYDSSAQDHAMRRPGESMPGYVQQSLPDQGYAYPRYGNSDTSNMLSISGGGVTVKSNLAAGGAIFSWQHNGKEYVNIRDYGREIQSAYFDPNFLDPGGYFGLINPTEAGGRWSDQTLPVARRHGSVAVEAYNDGLTQVTRSLPVEWDPNDKGGDQYHPILWSDTRLGKNITLDYNGMGAVAKYETTLIAPKDGFSQIEIPTGYMTAEFRRFWTYDTVVSQLTEVFPVPNSNTNVGFGLPNGFGGVIISNDTNTHAMGVYGVDTSQGGSVDYMTLWDFSNFSPNWDPTDGPTTKWSAVHGPGVIHKELEYTFTSWVVTGTLAEVQAHMDTLYASGELGAVVTRSQGDVNHDGFVNQLDIDDFVLALNDRDAYVAQTGRDPDVFADFDGNGLLDVDDIDDFITLFNSLPITADVADAVVPEPVSGLLLAMGGMALSLLRRRRTSPFGPSICCSK